MSRPRVTVHMLQTVDGRITLKRGRPPDDAFTSLSPYMTGFYQEIRDSHLRPEALLCGSETILVLPGRKDSPLPPARGNARSLYEDYMPAEVVEPLKRLRWFAVPDSRGRIRWGIKESEGFKLLVLASHSTPSNYLDYLRREYIPYLIVGKERVDLRRALEALSGKFHVKRVVSEGGGRLNGELIRQGLVDEISLVIIPAVIGREGTPTSFDIPQLASGKVPTRLRLISFQHQADGILWARYEVIN